MSTAELSKKKAAIALRRAPGMGWKALLLLAAVAVCLVFILLLFTTINRAFGLVAFENTREPTSLVPGAESVDDLTRAELLSLVEEYFSEGLLRRLESETPLTARSDAGLRRLVQDRIIDPRIVRSWSLFESFFQQNEIQEYAEDNPEQNLAFRSWLNLSFLTSHQSSRPEEAGIRAALLGTLWIVGLAVLVAFPVGVMTALYMEEYARRNLFTTLVNLNIRNLAGIPPVIYGLLGLAIFVRRLQPVTSGAFLGIPDAQSAAGRTILSGGLTLALLILPLIVINTQEALRSIPSGYRQACLSVGAPKWRVVVQRLLPYSFDRLLTVVILAISRVIGETTPLIIVGAATFIVSDPAGIFSQFTTLPAQIFFWSTRPQLEFRNLVAAAIVVLLILSFGMNILLIRIRESLRQSKKDL